MAVPEGPTVEVAAKASPVPACVPKGACVVLPRAGWPGVRIGAWAGAEAAGSPPLESEGAPEIVGRWNGVPWGDLHVSSWPGGTACRSDG